MPPGGAPKPPECVLCVQHARGRRTSTRPGIAGRRLPDSRTCSPVPPPACSAIKTPLDDAPQRAGCVNDKAGFSSGDKFCDHECVNTVLGWECQAPTPQTHHRPGDSMPFALMTAAASGVVRCLIRALAASGCLAVALTPAVLTNQLCSSAGRGPTNCTPLADRSEGVAPIASSTSPAATACVGGRGHLAWPWPLPARRSQGDPTPWQDAPRSHHLAHR